MASFVRIFLMATLIGVCITSTSMLRARASGAADSTMPRAAAVYAWGFNGAGRLGEGTTKDQHAPVAVTSRSVADSTIVVRASASQTVPLTYPVAAHIVGLPKHLVAGGPVIEFSATFTNRTHSVQRNIAPVFQMVGGRGCNCVSGSLQRLDPRSGKWHAVMLVTGDGFDPIAVASNGVDIAAGATATFHFKLTLGFMNTDGRARSTLYAVALPGLRQVGGDSEANVITRLRVPDSTIYSFRGGTIAGTAGTPPVHVPGYTVTFPASWYFQISGNEGVDLLSPSGSDFTLLISANGAGNIDRLKGLIAEDTAGMSHVSSDTVVLPLGPAIHVSANNGERQFFYVTRGRLIYELRYSQASPSVDRGSGLQIARAVEIGCIGDAPSCTAGA